VLSAFLLADLFTYHIINANMCGYLQGCRGSGETDFTAGDAFNYLIVSNKLLSYLLSYKSSACAMLSLCGFCF
jgi:hypothetical protein